MQEKKHWFSRKPSSRIWVPATWQGWLIVFLYGATLIGYFISSSRVAVSWSSLFFGFIPIFLLATVVLILIVAITGEKRRWRWSKQTDN